MLKLKFIMTPRDESFFDLHLSEKPKYKTWFSKQRHLLSNPS